jgi:hypothetical protein
VRIASLAEASAAEPGARRVQVVGAGRDDAEPPGHRGGHVRDWVSGVQVATITRSMSDGDSPLFTSAFAARRAAYGRHASSGAAIRRLAMPTRT